MRIGPSLLKGAFVLILLALAAFQLWLWGPVPSFSSIKTTYKPSDIWVVDREGKPLESVREGKRYRSLDWVGREEISPEFVRLLLKAEDQRFESHGGVDFFSLGRVARDALLGRGVTGGSTLTMQLVKLLEPSRGQDRSVQRKVRQILGALRLEQSWSKAEILEAYVNLVSFRGELVGLRAASLGYFQKQPSGLLAEESALLVALLRSPNASPQRVAERACRLLDTKECLKIQSLSKLALGAPYRLPRAREYLPILAKEFIKPESKGTSLLATTLDARIQKLARDALREQLTALKDQNVKDGAVLVLRTQTGEVLAYVGNAGPGVASASQIDGVHMRRQAGSTIKPFLYAKAFEEGLLSPRSLLDDSPLELALSGGKVYRPRNYDNRFRGLVGAGEALGSSLNVPAVRVLSMLGEGPMLALLHELGFSQLAPEDYYGHSLALGTVDVSLWELTQGYRQLGAASSPLSMQTREQLFDVLAAPEYRRFSFGLDSVLVLPFPSAVKTGTSQDMRDNWCVGWNDEYTIGVWVGNFDGKPMWHVSGVSGAAPVWQALMRALPPQVVRREPRYETPDQPLPVKTLTRIRYPTSDMLVALDPDIPKEQQRLPIEIDNPRPQDKLYLNRKMYGSSQALQMWTVERGRYHLELKADDGKVLDQVSFVVR